MPQSLYYLPEEDTNASFSCIFSRYRLLCRHAQSDGTTLWIEYSTWHLYAFFEEIWAAFQPDDKNYFTLMEYRLPPRAVLAILLGGALAISVC